MTPIPSYFLTQPQADWGAETIASFDALFAKAIEHGADTPLVYDLTAPKWQFLNYLCEQKHIVLHGSGNPHIAEFEPRQSNDVSEFGNRRAVYAASDGIWAMYFAIVDRDNHITSLMNVCFRLQEACDKSEPYYFFSVNGDALPHSPWRTGTLYLLPKETFEQQPPMFYHGVQIESAQWASLVPVKPLAKLTIEPYDFPFLDQIVPQDPSIIRERAKIDPDGFPWMDEI